MSGAVCGGIDGPALLFKRAAKPLFRVLLRYHPAFREGGRGLAFSITIIL